jgi:hypothetical protein
MKRIMRSHSSYLTQWPLAAAALCAAVALGGCSTRGGGNTAAALPQPTTAAQLKNYLEAPRLRGSMSVQQQAQVDEARARASAPLWARDPAVAWPSQATPPSAAPSQASAVKTPPATATGALRSGTPVNQGIDLASMAAAAAAGERIGATPQHSESALVPPPMQAAAVPQAWKMLKSDANVSATLKRWAAPLGVELVWETDIDARITGDAVVLVGGGVEHAVIRLMEGLQAAGYPLRATFYGRQALHISEVRP